MKFPSLKTFVASTALVGLFSFGVTIPAEAVVLTGTDTYAATNIASVETLMSTSTSGTSRKSIQEDGLWGWLDTTAD